MITVVILTALIVFTVTNGPKVMERRGFLRLESYVSGFYSRLRLYSYGVDQWKEHPFVGRGPGTSSLLISRGGEVLIREKEADHFHNVLIDTMVQTGIIGIGFHFLMLLLIIRALFRAKNTGTVAGDFFLFCAGGIALLMLAGISGQPLHSPHGVYLLALLGGICYSSKLCSTNSLQVTLSHSPTVPSTPSDPTPSVANDDVLTS
jgi:O-antigen ligase